MMQRFLKVNNLPHIIILPHPLLTPDPHTHATKANHTKVKTHSHTWEEVVCFYRNKYLVKKKKKRPACHLFDYVASSVYIPRFPS